MDSPRHVKNQLYWSDEECRIENWFVCSKHIIPSPPDPKPLQGGQSKSMHSMLNWHLGGSCVCMPVTVFKMAVVEEALLCNEQQGWCTSRVVQKCHLQQPNFSKVLTKLAILPQLQSSWVALPSFATSSKIGPDVINKGFFNLKLQKKSF